VEVKSRMEGFRYQGKTAVTREKQKKILKTAFLYLSEHNYELQPRFDVAEIYFTRSRKAYINYLENAYGTEALLESDLW
jgi:putative endonuclease